MKYITFVRHAKSSWDSFAVQDHDRPLNNRGEKDSIFMGKKLLSLGCNPQQIITSSAKRARITAENIAKELSVDNIVIKNELYESLEDTYLKIIHEIDNSFDNVMLVGHNPTLTNIINIFTSDFIYNVPTTGIFKIEFDTNNWKDVDFDSGKLKEFIYPKMFKK